MDKKEYLEISKAGDIRNKRDRMLYRLFEIFPGALSLGTLIGVFVFSWLFPFWVAIFIICFCFYYLLRTVYFSSHQVVGYIKTRRQLKKDWMRELKKTPNTVGEKGKDWKKIYHMVFLPTYKEGKKIIEESINSILRAEYPKEKLIIILAVEDRAGEEFLQMAKEIEKKYKDEFYKFLTIIHQGNVAGEIAGKGSNVAHAAKEAKKLLDKLNISVNNVIVSNFDIDTKVYRQYFSCLTWYYLNEKNPDRASYQPVPVYHNNIWKVPFFSRLVSTSNTFWQMIQQERTEKMTTYSSHAVPGKVFFEVGYPSNVVCDDSRIFWRSYLYYNGDYRVVPIYYLISMDAVDSPNFFKTIKNQYLQQRRWAWGCAEIPYLFFGFLNNSKISFFKKVSHLFTIVEGYWSWATAALMLFILGWLPIMLGGQKFNFTVLSFDLPILSSRIMTISLVGMMASAILSTLISLPVSKGVSLFKKISIFLQWVFLPVILIVFGSFPALDAQIRLMTGKYLGFWVTEKRR